MPDGTALLLVAVDPLPGDVLQLARAGEDDAPTTALLPSPPLPPLPPLGFAGVPATPVTPSLPLAPVVGPIAVLTPCIGLNGRCRACRVCAVTPLVSNIAHFMPPNAMQPTYQTHGLLATNDARVLGAFLENDKIQFVHNTMDTATGHCAVYHGIISNVACSGLINALGCGSKVNTAACPPLRRADCTAASMTTRCPR